jgi:uncharacterized membrane protein
MFHMIRQNATGSTAVLIRILDVLATVASCEPLQDRHNTLARHARLVVEDARRSVQNVSDLHDLLARFARFEVARSARWV